MVHSSIHVPANPYTDGYLSFYVRMDPGYIRSQPGLGSFQIEPLTHVFPGALELLAPVDEKGGKVVWRPITQASDLEKYEGSVNLYHFSVSDSSVDAVYSYRYDLIAKYGFALVYKNGLGDFYLQAYGKNWSPEKR